MKKSDLQILVVDDDASIRDSLTEAIQRLGYRVTAVGKADDALTSANLKAYHLALVDCMLPKTNGVELAMTLRQTRFGSAPLLLMSGVFKDRSFAAEAIEKTGAVHFFNKPFNMSELRDQIDKHLQDRLSSGNVPLHVLVSKPFSSPRERTKVIEGLEKVKGSDVPFVLSVLMEAGASGHLNFANANGEIYGVGFQQGKIAQVDSSESEATLTVILLQKGYVSREDLQAAQVAQRRGDLITTLIEQNLLSPHVLPIVRKEQMLFDLKNLFSDQDLSVNFVPDQTKKDSEIRLELSDLTLLLHDVVERVLTFDYLKSFYQEWMEFPIQVGPTFKADSDIFLTPVFQRLPKFAELLQRQLTIEELKRQGPFTLESVLKALHLLTLRRLIIFDDVKKARDVAEYSARMTTMLKELKKRNPFQVFAYFGCGDPPRGPDVERVYREFSRSNHPDLLPPTATPEVRQIVNQVFSIVSEAHDVISNPEKRLKFLNDQRQAQAESQIRAENLAEEAANFLKRGQASEALVRTQEALKLYPSSRNVKIAHAWALLKIKENDSANSSEVNRILETLPHDERRIPQYLFVQGLLKKSLGDIAGAGAAFDKAMALDNNFLEARREKSALSKTSEKKGDIFSADLGQLVGSLFKKRG